MDFCVFVLDRKTGDDGTARQSVGESGRRLDIFSKFLFVFSRLPSINPRPIKIIVLWFILVKPKNPTQNSENLSSLRLSLPGFFFILLLDFCVFVLDRKPGDDGTARQSVGETAIFLYVTDWFV